MVRNPAAFPTAPESPAHAIKPAVVCRANSKGMVCEDLRISGMPNLFFDALANPKALLFGPPAYGGDPKMVGQEKSADSQGLPVSAVWKAFCHKPGEQVLSFVALPDL
jgi:hypothetical protein